MRNFMAFVSIILLVNFCENKEWDMKKNSYEDIELAKNENCSIYAMVFHNHSEYLFKIGLSGNCDDFIKKTYLDSYEQFIVKNFKQKDFKQGKKFIVEVNNQLLESIEDIVCITEKKYDVLIDLKQKDIFTFEMIIRSSLPLVRSSCSCQNNKQELPS